MCGWVGGMPATTEPGPFQQQNPDSLEPVRVPGWVETLPVDVRLVGGVAQLHLSEGVRGV